MLVALAPHHRPTPYDVTRAEKVGRIAGLVDGWAGRPADPFCAWCTEESIAVGTWAAFRGAYLSAYEEIRK